MRALGRRTLPIVALVVLGILLIGVLPVSNAVWMEVLGIQGVVNVGILSPTPGTGCTHSQGYWKNHPDAWPVEEITIGGVTYSIAQAVGILETPPAHGDATYILAHQLIAAKLNIANGADGGDIQTAIDQVDEWLVGNPLGSNPGDAARVEGIAMAETLAGYNEGAIGPGRCDEPADPLEILGLVSPAATATATPSPDPAPEDSPTPTETEFPTPTESPTPAGTETPSG